MKKLLLLCAVTFISITAFSQEGSFYTEKEYPINEKVGIISFSVLQDYYPIEEKTIYYINMKATFGMQLGVITESEIPYLVSCLQYVKNNLLKTQSEDLITSHFKTNRGLNDILFNGEFKKGSIKMKFGAVSGTAQKDNTISIDEKDLDVLINMLTNYKTYCK